MPLGSSPQQSTWRAFRMSARQTTRTIHSTSLPNDPTVELPKPFFALLASTDKPECRDGTGEFETHIAVAHDACPHRPADEPSSATLTNRHRPRQRPAISHADDPSPFSRKLRACFPCAWQKTQRTKGTAMNDFSSKLRGKRGSGPLNPLPLR